MSDERDEAPRPDRTDTTRPARKPAGKGMGEGWGTSRSMKVDQIHRLGWVAYVGGVILLLGLLIAVGSVLAGWMASYSETAVTMPESP